MPPSPIVLANPPATRAARLAGKRLLIAEEALKNPIGHWYEYVRAVVELNEAEGAEVLVAAHRDAMASVRTCATLYPVFDRTNWDGHYAHSKAWRRYIGIARHNWLVFRTMDRFVREHGPFDCLFAPTVVVHQLAGWRLLMARHGGRSIKRMVLLFRNNAGSYREGSSKPHFKRSAAVLGILMRSFSPWLRTGQAEFATDSAVLAAEYRCLSGIEPTVFPSPRVSAVAPAMQKTCNSSKPITFSSLGPARFEKGIDIMQEAIRRYLENEPEKNVRFVIQWNCELLDEAGVVYEADRRFQTDPRVRFIRHAMSSSEYDEALMETDVMLLPYRRESYFARISGVAVEAVTAGIPIIYTRDTWCERLVTSVGAGLGVKNNDASDLLHAINDMVRNFKTLQAEAQTRAELAREAHSGASFLRKLWEQ
jgi:glycosyltransferase involved in cell wall biosynthesis